MMTGQWTEVARLRFKGERFRDHALDLSAVTELRQFQKMVAETAKVLWRTANPDRKNLPPHFDQRTRLCLRRIEDGSATVPLEVYLEEPEQPGLWEKEPVEVNQAIDLAYQVFDCIGADLPLPEQFPRELISEYTEWGKTIASGEAVELQPTNKARAVVLNGRNRMRLAAFAETPHVSTVEITGEVLEADVRQRRCQVWVDDKTSVPVPFAEHDEGLVTSALKEHCSVRIRVRGVAEVSSQGKPIRLTSVEKLEIIAAGDQGFDPRIPSIEDELAHIAAGVPAAEWAKLPADLNEQLDHYVYGTPRR